MSDIYRILQLMVDHQASDAYLSGQSPILVKVNGVSHAAGQQRLPEDAPRRMLQDLVPAERLVQFDQTGELNTSVRVPAMGSFRISAMKQRGQCAVVLRYIPEEIPALEELNLPAILARLVMRKRGLVLVVGATGSGKSTALAAMIDHRNALTSGHILTVEDPIEYTFVNQLSIVNQREVGTDTASLSIALHNAMRQAPDVIMIGEIRDRATMTAALSYAQSGHLCLATLHAATSYQALHRILSFYPEEVRPLLQNDLASALQAVISLRLLRTVDGTRLPATEVMLNTRSVAELIEKGDFNGIRETLERGLTEDGQTFEQDIARLIASGRVSREEGLANADSPSNLLWRLQNTPPPSVGHPALPAALHTRPGGLADLQP
ncbi:MAG: PilT/PilU family type 4a pilus ATPase [Comamonas sp.]